MSYVRPWVRSTLAVLVLAALMLVIRWPALDRSFWKDEIFSMMVARQPTSTIGTYVALQDTHPPLYYALLRAWVSLGGESEAWARGLSLLLGALQVWLLGATAAEMAGTRARWFTLVVATACWAVAWPHVMARNYVLLNACAAGALWSAVKALQSRDRWFYWGALALFLTAAAYAFYYALHVACATAALVLTHAEGRRKVRELVLAASATLCMVGPWLPSVLHQAQRVAAVTSSGTFSIESSYRGAWDFFLEYAMRVTPWSPLGRYGLFVTLAVGVALCWRRPALLRSWWDEGGAADPRVCAWGTPLLAWIAVFVALVIACGLAGAFAGPTYASTLGGVWSLSAGLALARLRPRVGVALAAGLFAVAAPVSWMRMHHLEIEDWRGAAQYVARHVSGMDEVWVAPSWERNSLGFYGVPAGLAVKAVPSDLGPRGRLASVVDVRMSRAARAWLAEAAGASGHVWLVIGPTQEGSPYARVSSVARATLAAAGRPLLDQRTFAGVEVLRYGACPPPR